MNHFFCSRLHTVFFLAIAGTLATQLMCPSNSNPSEVFTQAAEAHSQLVQSAGNDEFDSKNITDTYREQAICKARAQADPANAAAWNLLAKKIGDLRNGLVTKIQDTTSSEAERAAVQSITQKISQQQKTLNESSKTLMQAIGSPNPNPQELLKHNAFTQLDVFNKTITGNAQALRNGKITVTNALTNPHAQESRTLTNEIAALQARLRNNPLDPDAKGELKSKQAQRKQLQQLGDDLKAAEKRLQGAAAGMAHKEIEERIRQTAASDAASSAEDAATLPPSPTEFVPEEAYARLKQKIAQREEAFAALKQQTPSTEEPAAPSTQEARQRNIAAAGEELASLKRMQQTMQTSGLANDLENAGAPTASGDISAEEAPQKTPGPATPSNPSGSLKPMVTISNPLPREIAAAAPSGEVDTNLTPAKRAALEQLAEFQAQDDFEKAKEERFKKIQEPAKSFTGTLPDAEEASASQRAQWEKQRITDPTFNTLLARYRSDLSQRIAPAQPNAPAKSEDTPENTTKIQEALKKASTTTLATMLSEHTDAINATMQKIATRPAAADIVTLADQLDQRSDLIKAIQTDPAAYLMKSLQSDEGNVTSQSLKNARFKQNVEKELQANGVLKAGHPLEDLAGASDATHQFISNALTGLRTQDPEGYAQFLGTQRTELQRSAPGLKPPKGLQESLTAVSSNPDAQDLLTKNHISEQDLNTIQKTLAQPINLATPERKVSPALLKRLTAKTPEKSSLSPADARLKALKRVQETRAQQTESAEATPQPQPRLKNQTLYLLVNNNGELLKGNADAPIFHTEQPTAEDGQRVVPLEGLDLSKARGNAAELHAYLAQQFDNLPLETYPTDFVEKLKTNEALMSGLAKQVTKQYVAETMRYHANHAALAAQERALLAARNTIPVPMASRVPPKFFNELKDAYDEYTKEAATDPSKALSTYHNKMLKLTTDEENRDHFTFLDLAEASRKLEENAEYDPAHLHNSHLIFLIENAAHIDESSDTKPGFDDAQHTIGLALTAFDHLTDQNLKASLQGEQQKIQGTLLNLAEDHKKQQATQAAEEAAYALHDTPEEQRKGGKLMQLRAEHEEAMKKLMDVHVNTLRKINSNPLEGHVITRKLGAPAYSFKSQNGGTFTLGKEGFSLGDLEHAYFHMKADQEMLSEARDTTGKARALEGPLEELKAALDFAHQRVIQENELHAQHTQDEKNEFEGAVATYKTNVQEQIKQQAVATEGQLVSDRKKAQKRLDALKADTGSSDEARESAQKELSRIDDELTKTRALIKDPRPLHAAQLAAPQAEEEQARFNALPTGERIKKLNDQISQSADARPLKGATNPAAALETFNQLTKSKLSATDTADIAQELDQQANMRARATDRRFKDLPAINPEVLALSAAVTAKPSAAPSEVASAAPTPAVLASPDAAPVGVNSDAAAAPEKAAPPAPEEAPVDETAAASRPALAPTPKDAPVLVTETLTLNAKQEAHNQQIDTALGNLAARTRNEDPRYKTAARKQLLEQLAESHAKVADRSGYGLTRFRRKLSDASKALVIQGIDVNDDDAFRQRLEELRIGPKPAPASPAQAPTKAIPAAPKEMLAPAPDAAEASDESSLTNEQKLFNQAIRTQMRRIESGSVGTDRVEQEALKELAKQHATLAPDSPYSTQRQARYLGLGGSKLTKESKQRALAVNLGSSSIPNEKTRQEHIKHLKTFIINPKARAQRPTSTHA